MDLANLGRVSKISNGQKINALAVACLLGIIGLGGFLRWLALSEPLWLDELHTAWCVSAGWEEVSLRAAAGNQSPLFFWIEYICIRCFGETELTLRTPSFTASILLLLVMPCLVLRWSSSWLAAVLATLITAVNDQFIFYSVEARPYALIQLVSLCQAFLFFEMLFEGFQTEAKRSRWLWYGTLWCCVTLLLFYLHYTTIVFVAAEALVVFGLSITALRRNQNLSWEILLPWAAVLVGMLPGIVQLIQVGSGRAAWEAMSNPNAYALQNLAYGLIFLVPGWGAWSLQRNRQTVSNDASKTVEWPPLIWLLVLVFVPVLFCYLGTMGHFAPLAHFRFSIASMTLLVATTGVLVGRLKGRIKVGVASFIILLAIATNPLVGWWVDHQAYPNQRQENWQLVFETVATDPGQIVFCPNLVEDFWVATQPKADFPAEYYQFALDGLYPVDRIGCTVIPAALQDGKALLSGQEIQRLRNETQGFWLLVRAHADDADWICHNLLGELATPEIQFEAKRKIRAPLNLFRVKTK